MSVLQLPVEVLEHILGFLDPLSLLEAEKTCSTFREAIIHSCAWRNLCRTFLRDKHSIQSDQVPEFHSTFAFHQFDQHSHNHEFSKKFYFKCQNLSHRWRNPDIVPHVKILDCVNVKAKSGMEMIYSPEDWRRTHNYTGVYDMVWLPMKSYLVCSVFDALQVWDMSTYECLNILMSDALDAKGAKTKCFHANEEFIVCGTDNGFLMFFDLLTGEKMNEVRCHSAFICDVKVRGNDLLGIDWFGNFHRWRVNSVKDIRHVETFRAVGGRDEYERKCTERLLDFNDKFVFTSVRKTLYWSSLNSAGQRVGRGLDLENDILCIHISNCEVLVGQRLGVVRRLQVAPGTDIYHPLGVFETTFRDAITSITASKDLIVFGDVNGEIHGCDKWNPITRYFTLESGRPFGAFVWAVQIDASRIFSGDSEGTVVVHDFWSGGE